jgi:hypothetical protein
MRDRPYLRSRGIKRNVRMKRKGRTRSDPNQPGGRFALGGSHPVLKRRAAMGSKNSLPPLLHPPLPRRLATVRMHAELIGLRLGLLANIV